MFWPLGGSVSKQDVNATLTYYHIFNGHGSLVSIRLPNYTSQQTQSISIIWSCASELLVYVSPLFSLLLAVCWSPPSPDGNIWLFTAWSGQKHHYKTRNQIKQTMSYVFVTSHARECFFFFLYSKNKRENAKVWFFTACYCQKYYHKNNESEPRY